jgi:hypothetical protein
VRVTKPDGRVAVIDVDMDATMLDHPDRHTTRSVLSTLTDSCRNGWIGRQLPRLLAELGIRDLSVTPSTIRFSFELAQRLFDPHLRSLHEGGLIQPDEIEHWRAQLLQAEHSRRFFFVMTFVVVAGTKR